MATPVDASMVEPATPAPAPVSVEPTDPTAQPAAAEGGEELPFSEDLLKIPAVAALFAGSPPAVSAEAKTFEQRPETKVVAQNKDALMQAGIGLYRSLDGNLGVLFNQRFISGKAIQQADKEGKLLEVAPPFDAVNQGVLEGGVPADPEGAPEEFAADPAEAAPASPAAAPVSAPASSAAPPPASVDTKLASARAKNLANGAPSSGPRPGAGRLLNNILKQPV